MKRTDRKALRTARAIRRQMEKRQAKATGVELPDYEWSHLKGLERQLHLAQQRGWQGAATQIRDDLVNYVTTLSASLNRLHATLASRPPAIRLPSEAELYRELLTVEKEFDEVTSDPKTGQVSVTIGPIVLEDIDLGRFEIVLYWGSSPPYRIVALDPNPAASNDAVTHPHVQGEWLCEGEGHVAIRAALAEGRLADFFLIVSQTLLTYGKGSAFVELDRWHGEACDACGEYVDEGSRCYCHHCDDMLCDACGSSCDGCDNTFCSDCLAACERCGRAACSSCLSACVVCRKSCCADCLTNDLCEECYAKRHEETDDESTEAVLAVTAV